MVALILVPSGPSTSPNTMLRRVVLDRELEVRRVLDERAAARHGVGRCRGDPRLRRRLGRVVVVQLGPRLARRRLRLPGRLLLRRLLLLCCGGLGRRPAVLHRSRRWGGWGRELREGDRRQECQPARQRRYLQQQLTLHRPPPDSCGARPRMAGAQDTPLCTGGNPGVTPRSPGIRVMRAEMWWPGCGFWRRYITPLRALPRLR